MLISHMPSCFQTKRMKDFERLDVICGLRFNSRSQKKSTYSCLCSISKRLHSSRPSSSSSFDCQSLSKLHIDSSCNLNMLKTSMYKILTFHYLISLSWLQPFCLEGRSLSARLWLKKEAVCHVSQLYWSSSRLANIYWYSIAAVAWALKNIIAKCHSTSTKEARGQSGISAIHVINIR